MLKLVDLDLKFDARFALKVICFEEFKLERVTFLAQSLTFLSEFCFHLLLLKKSDFKLADLFLKNSDPIIEQSFCSLRICGLLSQLLSISVFDVLLEFLYKL